MTSPGSSGASSPVHLAAPISPSSPHSIGLKDRLESETHALNFVKANLDLLVSLVLDTSLTADDAIITAPQFDLLGVLFCGGASHVQQYPRLSAAYPKWQQPHQLASKVLKWLRTRLALNDVLYPRVGTCTPNNSIITTLHLNMPVSQDLGRLILWAHINCLDSTFNVFTPRRSIFDGDNRGCYIGPFNAQYPHLRLHLVQTLPIEFEHAVRTAQDNVDGLRRLIDEFDTPVKKVLEQAIQAKFKEWLVVSGNMRQVLDLVQLEKARQHAV
ncbi:hypothetical protein DYB36_005617 [Aphanomyces astaci]|uniref:Uncharacterized protein n=1 Tax=Aphanomyces astaci TaxID=112090 RepID=A0A397AB75_APHAT|nr:hypothetical protein DYB36_005617 [Aphanomyces astaci]